MKSKFLTGIVVCCLSVLILLAEALPVFAIEDDHTVNDAASVIDGIVAWNLKNSGEASVQEWIDGTLAQNAGSTSEWYILTLRQSGDYDFTAYEAALRKFLENNEIRSASSRLKYALVLHAIGSTDDYIPSALNNSIGEQGIMSWIYGLHLLNNGYTCDKYTADEVIETLLSLQCEDGGWSISGEYGDVDVTAMTVQALAPHDTTNPAVATAVDAALSLLSARQQEGGGYKSYGVSNPESASQVLVALSSLGIDCATDERFIKNGNTVLDGITKYRLADESFTHTEGGASNETATVQAYYSMVSYIRMKEGKSPLYILERTELTQSGTEEHTEETEAKESVSVSENEVPATSEPVSYKPLVCLIISGIGGGSCLVLFALKKRHYKNFLAVGILTAVAVCIVFVTDFQSADSYYNGQDVVKENAIGTVTLTIRCDTIVGKSDSEYIPSDGVILDVTEFAMEKGDSVYDILNEAAQKYHIQVENDGKWDMVYIAGINYLYEFDFGDLSGWVYHVNGEAPSVGCGEYILSDGDEIAWLYTCDLGEDVK